MRVLLHIHELCHFGNIFGNQSTVFCRRFHEAVHAIVICFLKAINQWMSSHEVLPITSSTVNTPIWITASEAGAGSQAWWHERSVSSGTRPTQNFCCKLWSELHGIYFCELAFHDQNGWLLDTTGGCTVPCRKDVVEGLLDTISGHASNFSRFGSFNG